MIGSFTNLLADFLVATVPGVALAAAFVLLARRQAAMATAAALFLWGAFGAGLLSIAALAVLRGLLAPFVADPKVITAVAFGALVEEPLKVLPLLFLAGLARRPPDFRSLIVFGAATGLGFAMAENFLALTNARLSGAAAWQEMVMRRLFITMPMHACASIIAATALWFGRGRPAKLMVAAAIGLAGAIVLHTLWNIVAVLEAKAETGIAYLLGGAIFSGMLALWMLTAALVPDEYQ